MIPIISNLFEFPVTRKEVLKRAKRHKMLGLCYTLSTALRDYNINSTIDSIFPLFNINEAKRFGARGDGVGFWWPVDDWKTGRMDFLDWLIEQYKDDNENLRKLKLLIL